MRILAFSFLFVISHLFADNPYELVDFGSHPSAVVGGCVNVVSGDYVVNQEDLVIRGHEPIPIQRRYFMRDDGDYYGGWNCGFNHLKATVTNRYHLQLPEKIGVKLEYSINSKEARERILKNKKAYFTLQDPEGAITNSALGELSARNNPTNNVVYYKAGDQKEILVKGPDGSTRHYRTFSSMAEILLTLPGQDVWIYYYLRREIFPNGNVMVYSWEEHGKQRILSKVETKDPGGNLLAWAKFTHDPSDCKRLKWTHIETSDGRTLTYYFDSKFEHRGRKYSLLKEVRHSDQPSEHYEPYWKSEFEGVCLSWVKFPDERYRNIHHYCVGPNKGTGVKITKEEALEHAHYKRVKFLFEPVGEDKRLHQVYKFLYEPAEYKKKAGHTDVYDAYGNRTRYHYTGKYWLSAVLHYKGEAELFSQDLYHWSTKGWLRSKVLTGSKGDPLSATIYDYDSKGNVIIESFYGNLTGDESKHVRCIGSHFPIVDQAECFRVKRTYTEKNLLHVETFPNGMKIENVYLEDTDLLSAKYIYEGSEIVRRHFYTYEGSILIQEIVDDGRGREAAHLEGVTQRLIQTITPRKGQPFYGFPEEIEEAYLDLEKGMPILLKKQKIQYNSKGLVEKIDHWDAQGVYRYTLEYLYDARGRLEKQKDPIGRWRTLEYDANDNPIQEHDPNENFFIKNTYDFSNRPTVSSKIGVSGAKERVESQYNFLHQKISETNEQGNKTHYVHDPFGNLLVKTLPAIADETDTLRCPELRNTYNAQGKILTATDGEGNTTHYFYTSRGKPYRIVYPDGGEESYTYTLNGEVETHLSPEGRLTTYTYDVFDRVQLKEISKEGETLSREVYKYNAFHLLEKTDPDGIVTQYSYDGAGRKIQEKTENRITRFTYDSSGRLETIAKCIEGEMTQVVLKEYDLLDRVLIEKELDDQGRVYGFICYTYDNFSNKETLTKEVHVGEAVETYKYDPFRRLILKRDPLGYETSISYDDHFQNKYGQTVIQKVTEDPKGKKVIETFDTLGNLSHWEKQNAAGKTLVEESFFYDLNGKKIKQISTLYDPDKTLTKSWEYDERGRLKKLTESDRKTTHYNYNLDGLLEALTKPDGVVITYAYDGLGRQTGIQTSDGSCHYSLKYDAMGNVIASYDHVRDRMTTRRYNHFGELIHETLGNQNSLDKTYDGLGRRTSLHFSDGSTIAYTYDPYHLRSVSRLDCLGVLLYEHQYTAYDQSHNLLQEQPLGELDPIKHSVDLLSRRTTTASPYSLEHIPTFDPNGNVMGYIRELGDTEEVSSFTYDDLDQLISETGLFTHDYSYDSHHNRIQKDETTYAVDDLHQLTETSDTTFDHDLNGNRIGAKRGDQEVTYTYDGLDRLTEIRSGKRAVRLHYDSWNRCLTRMNFELKEGEWVSCGFEDYLYDDQKELGVYPYHLRILGEGHGAEIGATIAIEHQNHLYVPMHDLFGNIIALLSPDGRVLESYRYTTFGEEEITTEGGCIALQSFLNPWRYQSKRKITHLIYFGRRFYDPETGRWLSPDPKGFDEGPNLYQFVQNNPLIYFDFYGLSTESGDKYSVRYWAEGLKYIYYYTARTTLEGFATGNPRQMVAPMNAYRAIQNFVSGSMERPDIPHSKVYSVGEKRHSDTDFFFMNGIFTNKKEALEMGKTISQMLGGSQVHVMHNSSHGALDLFDYLLEKYNVRTNITDLAYKHITRSIAEGKNPVIFLHSEATAIYCSLARRLNQEQLERIRVVALGSAEIVPTKFGGDVMNFISKSDWVSQLSNPINCYRASQESWNHVHFLNPNSMNPITEHRFMNNTYFNQLNREINTIKRDLDL